MSKYLLLFKPGTTLVPHAIPKSQKIPINLAKPCQRQWLTTYKPHQVVAPDATPLLHLQNYLCYALTIKQ